MTGRAKWDAWNVAGNTYKNDAPKAEARYLQIARDLGWNEDVPVVAEDTSSDTADQNDDIWDSDTGSEGSSRGDGSGGGMGVGVSTMTALGHVEVKNLLSRFALSGDVEGLTSFLDEHPTTEINAPDENVSDCVLRIAEVMLDMDVRDTLHYTLPAIEAILMW